MYLSYAICEESAHNSQGRGAERVRGDHGGVSCTSGKNAYTAELFEVQKSFIEGSETKANAEDIIDVLKFFGEDVERYEGNLAVSEYTEPSMQTRG